MSNDNIENASYMFKFTSFVVSLMERTFYSHGRLVSSHPLLVLGVMLATCLIAGLGFLNLTLEARPEKLWIPKSSDYIETLDWQRRNYPDILRTEFILIEGDNVLEPKSIKKMHELRKTISKLDVVDELGQKHSYTDLCFRVPALGGEDKWVLQNLQKFLFEEDSESKGSDNFDWSLHLSREMYCEFYTTMPTACLYLGILDVWNSDDTLIGNLTQGQIIDDINSVKESPTYGYGMNFSRYLGGIDRNDDGLIVGAKSALNIWVMNNEVVSSAIDNTHFSSGISSEVNEALGKWEEEFVEAALDPKLQNEGLRIYPNSGSSFSGILGTTILRDVGFLAAGMAMLSIYVFLMLGRFNWVETRPILTFLGIVSVGLSVLLSYGICSALGIVYCPIHSILPLILLGLGVDDMFITVQSFNNLHGKQVIESEIKFQNLESRMAETMKKAGVAITVTSLTDFLAFTIGALTSLPALRSFCIYAAVGILSLYIMQITFFLAAFTLDQSRLEDSRNGFLWCIKHNNFVPSDCSRTNLSQWFLKKCYSKWMAKKSIKVAVLVFTLALTSTCIWGTTNLKQDFNIILFIPRTSYLSKFLLSIQKHYPEDGYGGSIYFEKPNFPEELTNLRKLTESLEKTEFIASVNSWYRPYVSYTYNDTAVNIEETKIENNFFSQTLGKFLFSRVGTPYASYFHFNQTMNCLDDAPQILASKIEFKHKPIYDRNLQITAMDKVKDLVKEADFSGFASATGFPYSTWETNKIIVQELAQNLTLALLAVFLMTSLMIANFVASSLVFLCVAMTLIDVMALMNWWGLTIDTVTCIDLVLCVGLSVDYSAHVALHFMQVDGTRDERVKKTLLEVGSPVFHGALSTFLAFVLLANSESYVFDSFFKVFLAVFIFGVYHGLVFLPVVLSLIGPRPYPTRSVEEEGRQSVHYFKRSTMQVDDIEI